MLLVFRDNGKGVSGENPDALFNLNAQGRNKKSGTGLGLAQVRAIVEEWQGTAKITSGEGQGFRLTIWLPIISEKSGKKEETNDGKA